MHSFVDISLTALWRDLGIQPYQETRYLQLTQCEANDEGIRLQNMNWQIGIVETVVKYCLGN